MLYLVLVLLLLPPVLVAHAQPHTLIVEVYPAPVGYALSFPNPRPSIIHGYRSVYGSYYAYRADISETGTLVVNIDDYTLLDSLVHSEGSSKLRFIEPQPMIQAYGLNFKTGDDIIIFGKGMVYISRYNIVYGVHNIRSHTLPAEYSAYTLVVDENVVDLRIWPIKVLSVSSESPITVYTEGGMSVSMRLSDLIDAPEACIAWFRDREAAGIWTGGVLLSPACVRNIEVLKTHEYAGLLFAVVFRVPSVPKLGGRIDYVVMSPPSAKALEEVGVVQKVSPRHKNMHLIVGVELSGTYLYVAAAETGRLVHGKVLTVVDATHSVQREGSVIPSRVCAIPSKSTVLYRVTWNGRPLHGAVEVLPGEVVLFEYDGSYYACVGDLLWVKYGAPPLIYAPTYRELVFPIRITSNARAPVLVFASNGRVFYGYTVEIPFEFYEKNEVFWFSGEFRDVLYVHLSTIFTTAFFAMLVVFVATLAGVVFFSRVGRAPETITLVWDVKPQPSLSIADQSTIEQVAKKHVESFGVCPSIVEIPMYYEVLPPIPASAGVHDEILVCPFKTNEETESVLREISRTLLSTFWGTRRLWRNRGYFYTVFGDEMLYMYFYKQEDETTPEQILANALESVARSSSFDTTHFRRPLGLAVIVDQSTLPAVKRELSHLEELSALPDESAPKTYNIRGYLSNKNATTTINIERIQEIADREVPRIIVVTRDNIHELLEYLSEKAAAKGREYMKRALPEDTP